MPQTTRQQSEALLDQVTDLSPQQFAQFFGRLWGCMEARAGRHDAEVFFGLVRRELRNLQTETQPEA